MLVALDLPPWPARKPARALPFSPGCGTLLALADYPKVVTPGAETMTYREAAIFAPRLISGRPPQLCLESRWIRPDDRMATLVGRELFGLPKRVGEVLLEDRFTEVRHGATSFRLSWERRSDFHHLEVASE